ncbi:hypothetical protein [Streptomyces griseus]|uniref:hypothetical protein n=1 Tax=Streptomyces griseus TaxID=1911 RepID=UPI0018FEC875|nr:hypothetical protein [Streptomyces griseus]
MENPVVRRPETGWSRARRLRGKGVRTWVAAVEKRSVAPVDHNGPEWNIVRGED